MHIKYPITRYFKKGNSCVLPYRNYNGWVYPKTKVFPDEEFEADCDSDDISDDDWDNSIRKDFTGKRIGGLFRCIDDDYEYMMILNYGYDMRLYPYPKVNIPFKSPMVRWWNLFYCGGFSIIGPNDEDYSKDKCILDAVINKEKPIGFAWLNEDKLQAGIDKVKAAGLPYSLEASHFGHKGKFLGVSQTTTFGETFNVGKWLFSYRLMSDACEIDLLDDDDEGFFWSLIDKHLSYWLNAWDYANPKSNRELALTGLLLGYPVESTVSIMLQ